MELITIAVWVLVGALVYKMAERRNRNAWGWAIGSILLSPIVGVGLLLILGDNERDI